MFPLLLIRGRHSSTDEGLFGTLCQNIKKINAKNLLDIAHYSGVNIDEARANVLIQSFDGDCDGFVTSEEFRRLLDAELTHRQEALESS